MVDKWDIWIYDSIIDTDKVNHLMIIDLLIINSSLILPTGVFSNLSWNLSNTLESPYFSIGKF